VDFIDFIREVRGGAEKMLRLLWKIRMGALAGKLKAFNRRERRGKAAKFAEKYFY
jgi:hypothetical protein